MNIIILIRIYIDYSLKYQIYNYLCSSSQYKTLNLHFVKLISFTSYYARCAVYKTRQSTHFEVNNNVRNSHMQWVMSCKQKELHRDKVYYLGGRNNRGWRKCLISTTIICTMQQVLDLLSELNKGEWEAGYVELERTEEDIENVRCKM